MITFAFFTKKKLGFKIECTVMSTIYNYRLKRIITVYCKCVFATSHRSKILKFVFKLNLLFMKIIVRWKKHSITVNE